MKEGQANTLITHHIDRENGKKKELERLVGGEGWILTALQAKAGQRASTLHPEGRTDNDVGEKKVESREKKKVKTMKK